ncbi:quinone oxidoreductase [Cytophagaceae bacterium YF14B1]|uniref:Quinone oxidoreductase n=1 Tax=Xanthocytophaga flava TaxID=3048013 RepID=A0AAE3QM34_9BACT|nr:quinone oxidoreductase [Xanthocytophaga flavus]MDJ1481852.1 quinone oxidoreductase [Xanthocytophaga flavus]
MKALTLSTFGKPDVLVYQDVMNPVLKPTEVLVEMKAIGLNFADLMRRNGTYPLRGQAPYINGYEGAGIIVDANNHPDYKTGDRVAFADVPFANAELVAVPVDHIIPLPEDVSFETAAASMLQGLTAQYLTSDSHLIKAGETVLIHASAGGVGQWLLQVCKLQGANVIGMTSSENKREISLSFGADETFLYSEDWKTKVLNLFPQGVDVVYDSIGTTLDDSLQVTRILGKVVLFGLAGGKLEIGDPLNIIAKSQTIIGGDLWNYLTSKEERIRRSKQLFAWLQTKQVQISPPTLFKLSEGKKAHEFLESRQSTGKIVLIP